MHIHNLFSRLNQPISSLTQFRLNHFNWVLTVGSILLLAAQPRLTNHASTNKDFGAYNTTVPGTSYELEMLPIPGGKFMMGSPDSEEYRQDDEGPQVEVTVDPFWMSTYEMPWDIYEVFVFQELEKRYAEENGGIDNAKIPSVDAVSRPTPPYLDMSFNMGKYGYPAICMTQYAASQFCRWLSAKTGHYYRLPTEAEWEYACRAGTTTAYSFGDDIAQLDEYAWHYGNTDGGYEKIGTKKPNPWGLHDMHGNVAEWTLDQYNSEYYASMDREKSINPWNAPTELYPRVARGGTYDDDPEMLRSAARLGSNPNWKIHDPQIPKSRWWHTNARWVGIRVVRPKEAPSAEMQKKYWINFIEDL